MIKRFMLAAVLVSTLALQGCFYQTVDAHEVEIAEKICDSVGYSVVHITEWGLADTYVTCSNDKNYLVHSRVLEK